MVARYAALDVTVLFELVCLNFLSPSTRMHDHVPHTHISGLHLDLCIHMQVRAMGAPTNSSSAAVGCVEALGCAEAVAAWNSNLLSRNQ